MALESGRVNSYREALVVVRFSDGAGMECVVDTGFDGGLMLPRAFLPQIQIAIVGELTFEMVGGATMSAEVGLIEINWLGELRQVEVIVSEGDDSLVGTELLLATTLTIDYPSSILTISSGENVGG
jgi:predicted aspartyl protease